LNRYNEKLVFFALCALVLLVLFRIIIALTDLDAATFKRQAEFEKLQYYQTLNKVYGEVFYQEGRYYEKDPCDR
jgi:hypothetical protein